AKTRCFYENSPFSGRADSGHELLQRKIIFPGSSVDVSGSVFVTALVPKAYPVSGVGGKFKPPSPFGRERDKKTPQCFSFRQRPRFGTDFSDPLGPTDPC
ncbi:hypothetical protein JTE90_017167, partial [Oedothorax gibbosus]